jgi:hypothetical protein
MKLSKFALVAVFISTLFVACSKDDDAAPSSPSTSTLVGLYTGSYGFGSETPDIAYKLNFKSNGVIQEIGLALGEPTGEGTYSLSGNKLSAKYKMLLPPYNDYFIEATYDSKTNTLSGTWSFEAGGLDGGLLSVKK